GDGLPAEAVLGLPGATVDVACVADAVVLLGGDVTVELPVLYLRLRGAAVAGRTAIHEVSATTSGLTRYAATSTRHVPGAAADGVRELLASGALDGAANVVCVLGRPSLAESADAVLSAAAALVEAVPGVTFLSGLRRANVHGALDMGLAPGLLPGRVSLDDGRAWFTEAWGDLPDTGGLDARGILEQAAAGRLSALVLLGADPLADFPDRDLARRAMAGAGYVVSVDALPNASTRQADVVLPARMAAEKTGTTTNLEGRVSRVFQKVTPPGTAWADWMIAVELAARLGADLGLESAEQITEEIAVLAPAYRGLTAGRLARSVDGVVAGRQPAGDEPARAGDGPGGPAEVAATSAADAPEVHAVATLGEGEVVAVEPLARHVPEPPGAEVPPAVAFRPAASATTAPGVDRYSLRLVSHRVLYDDGTLVHHARSLAPLAAESASALAVNPGDLERMGVGDGDQVRVSSARTALTLTARASDRVPRGTTFLAFAQAGPGAADLVDAATAVTDVRVETL
ncbi:MAG: molybdopterin oxidoreductase family protein, partial [Acidimicrobiia bacterium]